MPQIYFKGKANVVQIFLEPFITPENSAESLYKSNLISSCNFLAVQPAVSPNIPYTLETPSNEYQRLLNQQVSVSKTVSTGHRCICYNSVAEIKIYGNTEKIPAITRFVGVKGQI